MENTATCMATAVSRRQVFTTLLRFFCQGRTDTRGAKELEECRHNEAS